MSDEPPHAVSTATATPRSDTEYVIGMASDLPEGGRLLVRVDGREIGILKVNGKIHAFLNRCPHRGGELCKGELIGFINSKGPGDFQLDSSAKYLACPWHGWEYDIETGESWYLEPLKPKTARRYQNGRALGVRVKSGAEVTHDLVAGKATVDRQEAVVIDAAEHRTKGPYTAEVFPVSVEHDYIVLTLRPVSVLSGPANGPSPSELRRKRNPDEPLAERGGGQEVTDPAGGLAGGR